MATDKAGRWIEVRSGFGDFNMSDLGPNEKVMASGLHDGGWTVMRKVAEASTAEKSPEPRLGICEVTAASYLYAAHRSPHAKTEQCWNWRESGSVGESPAPATPHWVSVCCGGEVCRACGAPATHKLGEEQMPDDKRRHMHNLTAYVCCTHFKMITSRCEPLTISATEVK